MRALAILLVAACGGSQPTPMTKPPEPVIPDAGIAPDATPPDAALPAAVTSAQPRGDAIAVASKTGKLALTCKATKRRLSSKCNDAKAPERDVRDCYVPDFQTPMPFGPAPGVEYVEDTACKGYRLATD